MKAVKIVHIGIILLWVFLLSFLFYKDHSGATLERKKLLQEAFRKETYWYDIYRKTKKIGFAQTSFEQAGDEILIKHDRTVRVFKLQSGEKTYLIKRIKCLTDLSYTIKSFEFLSYLQGTQEEVRVTGSVEGNGISLFLESSGKRKAFHLPVKNTDFYIPLTLIPVLLQDVPTPDMRLSVPILSFSSLSVNDSNVILEEVGPVKIGGNIQSIYKFRLGDLMIWSNEKGIIVKESLGEDALYLGSRTIAEGDEDRVLFDFTTLPYFKANQTLSDPEALARLTVRITGYRLNPQLYENSSVTFKGNTLIIEKKNSEILKKKTYTIPYEKETLRKYVSPDEWVRSEFPPLQNTGLVYARARGHDAFALSYYLNGYVYNLVKTWPVFTLSDATDVFTSLSGDHLERTTLFATYARAGGLPTRLVGGLVYVNGYFYFHTWPEVWLKMWVPLDPTLLQFPADVTHIPLKEGTLEDIVSITDDLKDIEIEVLEAS
jgi:hypothetical protein